MWFGKKRILSFASIKNCFGIIYLERVHRQGPETPAYRIGIDLP